MRCNPEVIVRCASASTLKVTVPKALDPRVVWSWAEIKMIWPKTTASTREPVR